MPSFLGKKGKKKDLIKNLANIYSDIQREHHISRGDFPDVKDMQEKLLQHDFQKFQSLQPELLKTVDSMLTEDISRVMAMIPQEQNDLKDGIRGGAFEGFEENPFRIGKNEGTDAGSSAQEWIVARQRHKYDNIFTSLNPIDGKLSAAHAKSEMAKSNLSNTILGKVWKFSDIDKDGMLDMDEFALAMYLIELKLQGHDLPTELPEHLVPPSKKEGSLFS